MSGGTTGAASPTRVITLPTPDIAPGSRPIYKPKSGATGPHPPKKLPSPSPDIMAAATAHRQKQNQENENKPKKTGSLALFARKVWKERRGNAIFVVRVCVSCRPFFCKILSLKVFTKLYYIFFMCIANSCVIYRVCYTLH